jgi:hypothetical protein
VARLLKLAALPAVAVAILGGATMAGASSGTAAGSSCQPISPAQLHAILGFPQSLQARNTVDSGEADRYLCNGVAWSGAAPSSFKAALQKGKAGQGAAFGIEAWTPNETSPDVQRWKDEDYDKLTGGFIIAGATWPGLFTTHGWPTKALNPPHLGNDARGLLVYPQGVVKGLVAAVGCWWDDQSYSAVCLMVEEAIGKPVVAHLNALAKIAVPKVL